MRKSMGLLLLMASVFTSASCSLQKQESNRHARKPKQENSYGYWVIDTAREGPRSVRQYLPPEKLLMLVLTSEKLQIFDMSGTDENLIGRPVDYENQYPGIETHDLTGKGRFDPDSIYIKMGLLDADEGMMKVSSLVKVHNKFDAEKGYNVPEKKVLFYEAHFRRISHQESLQLYNEILLSQRRDGTPPIFHDSFLPDAPETPENQTNHDQAAEKPKDSGQSNEDSDEETDVRKSKLRGFWKYMGIQIGSRLYKPGESFKSPRGTPYRVSTSFSKVVYHFREGRYLGGGRYSKDEFMRYNVPYASQEKYFPYSIKNNEIIIIFDSNTLGTLGEFSIVAGHPKKLQLLGSEKLDGTRTYYNVFQLISKHDAYLMLKDNEVYKSQNL